MRKAGAFLCLLVCIPVPARAGPPMLTSDSGTPGDGKWEINIAATLEKRRSESRWEAPVLDLNYGLGEHVQLSYEVPRIVLSPSGEGTKSGLGNSNVGVKWRFLDEEKYGVSMGEIHGTGRPNFRRHETVFNLGAVYDMGKNCSALLSAGRSFQGAASDAPALLLYIGMQLRP